MASARKLARYPVAVRAAAAVRNLAQVVVATSLSDGLDPRHNGEHLLMDVYGPRCRVIVDVGANVGDWSATMLARARPDARALLFEPSTSAQRRLRTRFAGDARVDIIEAAVSDRGGTAVFHEEPAAGETSSLLANEALPDARAREVNVTTLDDELARLRVTAVDILKVDAEGFDLHVLRGAERLLAARAIALVQFEYNRPWLFARSTLGEALRLLESHGYVVRLLRRDGLHELDYERVRETFGYANLVAFVPELGSALAGIDEVRV